MEQEQFNRIVKSAWENLKRAEERPAKRRPDWKGDGVAVWINQKGNKSYMSIKVAGHNILYAFKNERKDSPKYTAEDAV